MQLSAIRPASMMNAATAAPSLNVPVELESLDNATETSELRKQFDTFVGESFYGQMLGAMRKTVGKPAYFHGGQAEEIFRGQLDQMLASRMTEATAGDFTGPMFELFNLRRG